MLIRTGALQSIEEAHGAAVSQKPLSQENFRWIFYLFTTIWLHIFGDCTSSLIGYIVRVSADRTLATFVNHYVCRLPGNYCQHCNVLSWIHVEDGVHIGWAGIRIHFTGKLQEICSISVFFVTDEVSPQSWLQRITCYFRKYTYSNVTTLEWYWSHLNKHNFPTCLTIPLSHPPYQETITNLLTWVFND